jgi:hypothetical protein
METNVRETQRGNQEWTTQRCRATLDTHHTGR